MGTDYYPHFIIGVPRKEIIKHFNKMVQYKRYNRHTGEPYFDETQEFGWTFLDKDYISWEGENKLRELLKKDFGLTLVDYYVGVEVGESRDGGRVHGVSGITLEDHKKAYDKAIEVLTKLGVAKEKILGHVEIEVNC